MSAIFLDYWVIPYGLPSYLFMEIVRQFPAKLVPSFSSFLGDNQMTITAYNRQTKARTESYSRTIVACLRHYVAEYQEDWDELVQPLAYA